MTKVQMQNKLSLLPLLGTVTVADSFEDGIPGLEMSYAAIPGPGTTLITVGVDPSATQLSDLVNNLPLNEEDRLASLAIMMIPVGVE